jgi:hypothetical protein
VAGLFKVYETLTERPLKNTTQIIRKFSFCPLSGYLKNVGFAHFVRLERNDKVDKNTIYSLNLFLPEEFLFKSNEYFQGKIV